MKKVRVDGFIWDSGAWRSPEAYERRKKRKNEADKKKYKENPEFRKQKLEKKKQWQKDNKEAISERKRKKRLEKLEETRKIEREKSRKQRQERGHEINARQRDYYKRNAERLRKQINEARIRREPFRGLATALREFERRDRSFVDIDRLYRQRLALCDERTIQKSTGTDDKDPRPRQGRNGGRDRTDDQRANENETRSDKDLQDSDRNGAG